MGKLYPMPGDNHTGKNLEYIKDMIFGISLQIAGVATHQRPPIFQKTCDIQISLSTKIPQFAI